MTDAATALDEEPLRGPALPGRTNIAILITLGLVALGDVLLFGHAPGINLFVLAVLAGLGIALIRLGRTRLPTMASTLAVSFAAALPLIEAPSIAIVFWFRVLDGISAQLGAVEIGALAAALILTLIVAFVLTRTITGPIDALIQRSGEIARGGRAAIRPLDRYGSREIAILAQSFLDLADQLVERTDYIRSFAAHVSHELKSPLTAIKGAAELLRDEPDGVAMSPEERRRFLDHIVDDVDRLTGLLARLRELAGAELPASPGSTTLAATAVGLRGRLPGLAVEPMGDIDRPLGLSEEAAAAIFTHLAENAQQHGARQLAVRAKAEAGMVSIIVADDGSGISAGNRALVLQPFFSTRREQGGTGMGLSIVQAMLAAHGGSIRVVDSERGAAFEMCIPAAVPRQ